MLPSLLRRPTPFTSDSTFQNSSCPLPPIAVPSTALTSLLDVALHRSYEAELVPTTSSAARLLETILEMKECSALILRECRWMVGVPMTRVEFFMGVATGNAGVILNGDGSVMGELEEEGEEALASEESRWNEFEILRDFAMQSFSAAKEAIYRLTTDRLADSANLTARDSLEERVADGNGGDHEIGQFDEGEFGIGRCFSYQSRSGCWESPRLYCPDYSWADDCANVIQRLLKSLSRHKFVSLVNANGWNRYSNCSLHRDDGSLPSPIRASRTPHPFPSLEAVHALKYLASDLLSTALPSRLNQFRAAVEANAVVSKRLYLVKCEYRAPIRAHMESWMALRAAPKLELVERYLTEFHGTKDGEEDAAKASSAGKSVHAAVRRKNSNQSASSESVTPLQKQRDSLEELITENYWKHPSLLEALELERLCGRLEVDMSQILLPLSQVATDIMDRWKGRLRPVAVVTNETEGGDRDIGDGVAHDNVGICPKEILGWEDLPHMRELLMRLKSILRRKPGPNESSGIRPLLLDLQGVPRKNHDSLELSMEVPFYRSPSPKPTAFGFLFFFGYTKHDDTKKDTWFHLEQFIRQIGSLLKLLQQPDTPFITDMVRGSTNDRISWQELIRKCVECWDSDLFRAQYQDWFDMVKRQRQLDSGVDIHDEQGRAQSLSELSEIIREAEIELSIAMASKDQLEMVRQKLEALHADKNARYLIMAQIVNDVALRELNQNIIVLPTSTDMSPDFPKLSSPGLFGTQLLFSSERLPIG